MDDEIRGFQHNINLVTYAESEGYRKRPERCSARTTVLRHSQTKENIHVSRTSSGRWQYICFESDGDKGDIVQFVRLRRGLTLGKARQLLRQTTNQLPPAPPEPLPSPIAPLSHSDVERMVKAAKKRPSHPYLESRAIHPHVLCSPRFADTWRTQSSGTFENVIFPHRDRQGFCGFEVKNQKFTGFSKGGSKGLWLSNLSKEDNRLVVTESAIDAISYHQLYPRERTRYVSTGGAWSEKTADLLRAMVSKLPPKSHIIGAFDNDPVKKPGKLPDGERYHRKLQSIVNSTPDVTHERRSPRKIGDWNQVLQDVRREKEERTHQKLGRGR